MTESENNTPPLVNSKNLDYYDDPLFLSSSDQPYMQLLGYLFTGHNYLTWKRDSYHALISKNKEGFVDGTIKQPEKSDKRYHQWIRVDLMVMKWLLNSLEHRIRDTVQYVSSSHELWTELADRYGQLNSVEIYQLTKELSVISQENSPLIDYYSKLKRTWENIEHLDPIPLCTCGAIDSCSCKLLKRTLDRESHTKLIHFLMGLNGGYEGVKTNILSMDPLPPINKALSLLQKIERQKQVSDAVDVLAEANAYVAQQSLGQSEFKKPRTGLADNGVRVCSHCGQKGHLRDDCFKLKDCTFCGKRGHIKEHCFKLRDVRPIRGRGKPIYRGGANVYKRSAHNVSVDKQDNHDIDNPLDDSLHTNVIGSALPSVSHPFDSTMVTGIVSSVVQEVFKAFGDASAHSTATHFAGPFK